MNSHQVFGFYIYFGIQNLRAEAFKIFYMLWLQICGLYVYFLILFNGISCIPSECPQVISIWLTMGGNSSAVVDDCFEMEGVFCTDSKVTYQQNSQGKCSCIIHLHAHAMRAHGLTPLYVPICVHF